MPTDRDLMEKVARRDAQAFTELVDRWSARLLTLAWRMLGNRADAEDAVQRSLLNLYTGAAGYRPEWAVSTWLYRITTNVCMDEIRRRRSRPAAVPVGNGEDEVTQGMLFADGGRPAHAASESLDVQRALGRVPTEARILIVLRYMDGLSYEELARIRGITVNTVKSQLARGKSILKAELEGARHRRRPAAAANRGARP